MAESGFRRRGIGFTGLCLAGAQAIEEFGGRAIERQQVAAPALRQRLEEQRNLLGQHAGHQPFAAIGIDLVERMQRHGERDAIIGRTGLEVIGQREVDTPHAQQTWKARLVHAVGVLLQQCLTRELQQSGIGLDGLAVPLLQVARVADPGGHLGIEPGCQRILVDQQVGTADLVLQPLDIGDDLAVVADEVGIDGPFAGDQAVTDHQPSGFSRIDLLIGHAPGGVEHEAVEHAPLVCHGPAAVLFPVRVAPRTLDQVASSGFDPFRADGRGGARLQAAGIDQFGGHQPAGALGVLRGGGLSTLGLGLATVEDGRRMQHEFLLVRALPARPFGQAVGDVAQQAGEQRAMDDIRRGFVGIDLPVEPAHQLGELTDDIGPFTQLADGQELASDAVGQRPVRFTTLLAASLLLLPVAPQPDPGQEVGLRHVEAGVRLVGCLLGSGWAFARVLHGQGGRDDQDLGQAAGAMAGQQHACQARVDRQARKLAADGGEPLAIVDGAQFVEQGVAVGNGLGRRPVQEREGRDFGQAQRVHAQNDRGQRRAQDLGVGEGGTVLEVVFAEQADADAFGHPAAAAGTLVGGGARDGLDEELVDLAADAVAQHARQARIDDVADARDRQRGLGHVGGQHDARGVTGVEDALLVGSRQTGVEGHDLGAGQQQIGPAAAALPPACAATRHGALQVLGRLADLALAGQEDQHVARLLVPQLAHGGLDGRRQVGLVVLVFGLHVFRRPVADLDRIQAPGDLDDGCGPSGFTEVLGKAGGVDGGRGDDELEVIATRAVDELLEVAQQEVDV